MDGYEYNVIFMKDYLIEAFSIDNNEEEENEDMINYNNFNIYDNNTDMNAYKIINNEENNNKKDKDKEVLYFIKTEDENLSFIFYELKDNINDDENNIKLLFNKILKKILIKDSEEPIKSYKKICLPSFSYKKRNTFSENENKKEDERLKLIKHDVLDMHESFDFCIENISYNDIKFSFPLNQNINDTDEIIVIKNNFIIALLNPDLILDHHLPSMNIYYITKGNWIKSKNN